MLYAGVVCALVGNFCVRFADGGGGSRGGGGGNSTTSRRNEWAAKRGAYSFMQMSLNRLHFGNGVTAPRRQHGRRGSNGEYNDLSLQCTVLF